MDTPEPVQQQAEAFKARLRSRGLPTPPTEPGYSGPLGDVFLPADVVDEMEQAIEEAFEFIAE